MTSVHEHCHDNAVRGWEGAPGAQPARKAFTSLIIVLAAMLALAWRLAPAAEPAPAPGLFLTTEFPAMAVRAGETATVKVNLRNAALPPQRVALSVEGVPKGWRATILGGGVPVAAAMPASNEAVALQLRVDVPPGAKGSERLVLTAKSAGASAELPLEFTLGQTLPARLTLKPKLPSQRGSAKTTFEYPIVVHNEGDRDMVVKLGAEAPSGFQVTFSENYGSQEINSIPVEAGQNKEIKVKVLPLDTSMAAGDYPLSVSAAAEGTAASARLGLQITGAPKLRITTEDGRLSGETEIGKSTPLNVIVENSGSAPANDVTLSSSPPSDWKIELEPGSIPVLAPGQKLTVQAIVTPSNKAIAGDYMATLRANSGNETASAEFRMSVTTSTLWGVVGIVIIAIALLLSVGAVARFGRR